MRVKQLILSSVTALSVAVLCGCEWSSGGGASGWDDSYNWVNFSGTYRGINGGVLVTDYSTTPGTATTTYTINNEGVATANATDTQYAGTFKNGNVVAGSVSIKVGTWTFTETATGSGSLSAGSGTSGTITYGTGSWSINLGGQHAADGDAVLASYQYNVQGSSGSEGAGSGASGVTIYSFVVWQNGETLQITDNNGSVYKGSMGTVNGTINATDGGAATPGLGETVVAQFSAEGISAANYSVTIAGTLQGVVGGTETAKSLENRQMFGTWIEDGGRTGDVNGQASPITINIDGGTTDAGSTTTTTTGGSTSTTTGGGTTGTDTGSGGTSTAS